MINQINSLIVLASVGATPPASQRKAEAMLANASRKKEASNQPKVSNEKRQQLRAEAKEMFETAFAEIEAKSYTIDPATLAQAYMDYAELIFWSTPKLDEIMNDPAALKKAEEGLELAAKYFTKALGNTSSLDTRKYTEVYSEAGQTMITLGIVKEALGKNRKTEVLPLFRKGVELVKQAAEYLKTNTTHDKYEYDTGTRAQQIYYTIGWVTQYKLDDPAGAKKYYLDAIAHIAKVGAVRPFVDEAKIYLGLGEIYELEGNIAEADKCFTKADGIWKKSSSPDAEGIARLGEIYAIRILKEPTPTEKKAMDERAARLLKLIDNYFSRSTAPKARIWQARILGIAAESEASLRGVVRFVDANMGAFSPENISEARLIRGEAELRLEIKTVNPDSWKFERPLADLNAVINDPKATDDLKGKAYFLKGKILIALNDTTNARIALNEAEKLIDSIDPAIRPEVKKLNIVISGVETLGRAEQARIKGDYAEAAKLYKEAIDLFKSAKSPEETTYYLGQTYFGLAEVQRYGKGTKDLAAAKINYGLAIDALSSQTDPYSDYMTAMSHIGLAYIAFDEKNLVEVEKQYNLARAIFDEATKDHPNFDLLPELEVRILKLHGELLNAQGKPAEARKEFAAAIEAQKKMPAGPVATGIINEIKKSDRGQNASEVPPILEVRQVNRRGKQTTDNARSGENTVEQNFTGIEYSANIPISKGKNNFSIGAFYSDLEFDTNSSVKGDFYQYIATYVDGNPVYGSSPDDTMRLPILEGESMQRIRLSGSYYRDFGKWDMWAVAGAERVKISSKMIEYTWPEGGYVNNFHNPTPNETSFDHTANVFDIRAHANLTAYDGERFKISPSFEFYAASAMPNESSAFHMLTQNYIKFLESQADSTQPDIVDARKDLGDMRDSLKIENLTSWYVQPGVNFTVKEPEIGGATQISLAYRYGLPIIDESLYGYWPRNASMRAARGSANINLAQSMRFGNFEANLMGIYNQDMPSGAFEGGNYWVVEAAAGYRIPRTRIYPELYISHSEGTSADYSSESDIYGLRLKLLDF